MTTSLASKYYSCRVHTILYENLANAYYILKVTLDGSQDTSIIKGTIPGLTLKSGSWLAFEGHWVNDKTHGKQINITKAPVTTQSWTNERAKSLLASNGISTYTLDLLSNHFEDEFVSSLSDLEKLKEAPWVTQADCEHIHNTWLTHLSYIRAVDFLRDSGIPGGKIKQVWSMFGDEAKDMLVNNPWNLIKIDGISFQHADEVAQKLGLSLTHPNRARGAVLYACLNNRSFGHLYQTLDQVIAEVQHLIPSISTQEIAQAIVACHKEESIVIDRDTKANLKALYDTWSWKMEKEAAELLVSRRDTAAYVGARKQEYLAALSNVGPKTDAASKLGGLRQTVAAAVDEWGGTTHMALSDLQREGVINALCEPVSVLTGLPGSGKTTCIRAVVSILKDTGVSFLLCAPTGIAAKNLKIKAQASIAYTVHKAFGAEGANEEEREMSYVGVTGEADTTYSNGGDTWAYGVGNPHPASVVIIDEASMVDAHLMYRLMTCTRPECRLVIVGDAAQLPSVGPGNVLRDLAASNLFPLVALTEIFRQKDTSGIVYAAHAIYRGEIPDTTGKDFSLISIQDESAVSDEVVRLAESLYSKRLNFQVMSPRHAGVVGVTNLNARLRELLNPIRPGVQEIRVGQDTIREDDRIMVVKNNYKLKVYNGDVGKVSQIDRKTKEVEIKIFGDVDQLVRIPFSLAGSLLRLAYACSVHKMQGLEADVILMPLVNSFRHQLQRNLLYTGVTRARKRVILVGTHSALTAAVLNDSEDSRNTLFRERLLKMANIATGDTQQ